MRPILTAILFLYQLLIIKQLKLNKMVDTKKDEVPVTESTDTQPAQTMQETTTTSGAMSKLAAIIQKFYPGTEIPPTALPPEAEAAIEKLLAPIEAIVQFHDDFDKVVEEYPEFGDFIIALRNGYAPYEAFVEHLQPEEPMEGAPDYEGSKKAREAKRAASEGRKTRMAAIEKNIAGSEQNIAKLAEQKGWDESQTTEFSNNVAALFTDWADGNLTMPSLENLAKGFAFDTIVKEKDAEIEKAYEDGEIAGKNAKIQKTRVNKETGDGLARMTGTGADLSSKPDKFTSGLERLAEKKPII